MQELPGTTLVGQHRYGIDRWIWELPAGTLEPGEDVDASARRECQEESGYVPGHIERVGSFFKTPGYCDEVMYFCRLTDLTTPTVPAFQVDDEGLEPRVLDVDDARRLANEGEVMDMRTVLGLSMV